MGGQTGGETGQVRKATMCVATDDKQAGGGRCIGDAEMRRRAVSHPVSERQHARRHAHTTETP